MLYLILTVYSDFFFFLILADTYLICFWKWEIVVPNERGAVYGKQKWETIQWMNMKETKLVLLRKVYYIYTYMNVIYMCVFNGVGSAFRKWLKEHMQPNAAQCF